MHDHGIAIGSIVAVLIIVLFVIALGYLILMFGQQSGELIWIWRSGD